MNQHDLWDAFANSGRIEDYLRFRGVDLYTARIGKTGAPGAENAVRKEGSGHAADDRGADHTGVQSYR